MVAKVGSNAVLGISGYPVTVEVCLSPGVPTFDIVGLPDSSVKEAKERVRAAIKNSGLEFPLRRITINLAPAGTKKEGASFDLPIAVGILVNMGLLRLEHITDAMFVGELSLDGEIKPVRGVLPMAHSAVSYGVRACFVSCENAEEAALVDGLDVYGVKNLSDMIDALLKKNREPVHIDKETFGNVAACPQTLDFADVRGQVTAKRAIEVCAAGGHNLIMVGPPGSGKTMLAKRIPSVLPPLDFDEIMEVTKIHSIAGILGGDSLVRRRPFRSPHHSTSSSALTGGGRNGSPGEISFAHKGVLFLDELPEFRRDALEALRQPVEEGKVVISRAKATVTYPSDFMLVAAMNPCPCGYYGYSDKCVCSSGVVAKYQRKVSGPLLDRIDVQIDIDAVKYEEITGDADKGAESSPAVKERVVRCRRLQLERYANEGIKCNAELDARQVNLYCKLDEAGKTLLKNAFESLGLSVRAHHKVLRVARTIADLDGSGGVLSQHVAEAISYRELDRMI
ncbi:magnesium chelatase [Clostridia bacterium]|nr:magnesium chelatase [Clostridia bacterium]